MKKLVIIIASVFVVSCGGSTTNIYIYSNGKNDVLKIDSNTTTIDTIMVDGKDSVDVIIEHEEG
jgi:hypothetical protein